MSALADHLRRDLGGARRFFAVALEFDRPELDALCARGLPRYLGRDFLDRLREAGEIDEGGWCDRAREAYRQLIAEADPDGGKARATAPAGELPREKALAYGIDALADDELLALLLRTGATGEDVRSLARRLLTDHDGLVGLAGHQVGELVEGHGLGPAKACEIAAAFEIGRRLARAARRERPALRTPEDVFRHLAPAMTALPHEEFWCLPLDTRSRLIGEPKVVSRGDIDGTDAGPRAFFRAALHARAHAAIAIHNHPTGDASPSAADLAVTRRLVAAGRVVGLELIDHCIIGDGAAHVSIRRERPECFAEK